MIYITTTNLPRVNDIMLRTGVRNIHYEGEKYILHSIKEIFILAINLRRVNGVILGTRAGVCKRV